jgi:hypothetical protein
MQTRQIAQTTLITLELLKLPENQNKTIQRKINLRETLDRTIDCREYFMASFPQNNGREYRFS